MYRKIVISFNQDSEDKILDSLDIELILESLYSFGFILKPAIIEKVETSYNATVIAIGSKNILKLMDKINEICPYNINFFIEFGDLIANTDELCSCKDSSFYVLNPEYNFLVHSSVSSLLKCGDCGKQVLWNDIAEFTDAEKDMITNFQKLYDNLESLRLNTPYSDFSEEELKNPRSKYNQLAFKVCNIFENKIKIPVYLLLKNPVDGVYKEGKKDLEYCPICGSHFGYIINNKCIGLYNVNRICNTCKIILPCYDEDED